MSIDSLERELKPCPFCDSAARYRHIMAINRHFVDCPKSNCRANGPPARFCNQEAEAIAAWNTRAQCTFADGVEAAARVADEIAATLAQQARDHEKAGRTLDRRQRDFAVGVLGELSSRVRKLTTPPSPPQTEGEG